MLAIFSALYWIFFALTLPPLFVVALVLFLFTAPFDRRRVALHLFTCAWCSFYVHANPLWRVRVTGRERLPWRGAAVIVANPLSLVDILVLAGLYRPFKWVSKSSLFKVPFLGWNMALNDYVPVTRGAADSVRRMLAHCRRHLAAGSPLLLFPEGTRSATGELQPFKDGAFRLAREAGVPVIPVALSGTYESIPNPELIYGLPITRAYLDTRKNRIVQYFENARFESLLSRRTWSNLPDRPNQASGR